MVRSSKPVDTLNEKTVLIHSNVHNIDGVSDNTVVEFTNLKEECTIGSGCIVSNNNFPAGVTVPGNSFIHTVVICDGGQQAYVTVAFGTEDNLKKTCESREMASKLIYAGLSFDKALEKLHLPMVSLNSYLATFFPFLNFLVDKFLYFTLLLQNSLY